MKKTIFNGIFCSFILFSSQIQAQHLLEALEGQSEFTSTKSATKSGTFKRNNCDNNGQGKEITFTSTQTHTYTSNISQEDADNNALRIAEELAQDEVNSKGQEYANTNAKCIWFVLQRVSQDKTYTPYVYGKTCGIVNVNAIVNVWGASDISYHHARETADRRARQEVSRYLSTYSPTSPCVDNFTCQDHYEEEYLTSTETSGFSQCPVGIRKTRTSASYSSPNSTGSDFRSWDGSYFATCTVKTRVDFISNEYKIQTHLQSLNKYKTKKCSSNPMPRTKYEKKDLGTIFDTSWHLTNTIL